MHILYFQLYTILENGTHFFFFFFYFVFLLKYCHRHRHHRYRHGERWLERSEREKESENDSNNGNRSRFQWWYGCMCVCVRLRNKLRKYRSERILSLCDNQFRWNDDFIPNFSFSRFISIRRSIVFFRCVCAAHSVPRIWLGQHENQVKLLQKQEQAKAYSSPKTARKKGSAALCTFVRNDEELKNFIIIFRCEVYFYSFLRPPLTCSLSYRTWLSTAQLYSRYMRCTHCYLLRYMFPANVCKVYQNMI